MKKRNLFEWPMILFEASGAASGGTSGTPEPTIEQLRQQVTEIQAKYNELHKKVEAGLLVDPNAFLEKKIKDGEVFPKDRFTGMQKTFQEEQEAHKKTKETLDALTASEVTLRGQLSNLEKEKSTFQSKLDEDAIAIETLTRQTKRGKIIMEQFPHLSAFEAKGLLPEGSDEELPSIFENFSKQIGSIQEDALKKFGQGGGTATPPSKDTVQPAGERTSKAVRLEATQILLSSDPQRQIKYDKLMDEYFELQLKESAK